MAICNPLLKNCKEQTENPTLYTNTVIQSIFSIFLIVGVLYFIWFAVMAGYSFISSQGDLKKIETAKSKLTNAFMGIFIVFVVFALLKFVGYILGINNLENLTLSLPTL